MRSQSTSACFQEGGVMFTAISTTENLSAQIPTVCAMAVVMAMASTAGLISTPVQTIGSNQSTFFSTRVENLEYYNDENVRFWLEGDTIMSTDKAQNLMRLVEIEQLQENWNGNGANCFSNRMLSFAKRIVLNLLIQPMIFPTARDSIQFEYENDQGDYLELEIFENERIKVFSVDHMGKSTTEEITYDNINKVVSKFYGRDI